jgi:hypothetical protein
VTVAQVFIFFVLSEECTQFALSFYKINTEPAPRGHKTNVCRGFEYFMRHVEMSSRQKTVAIVPKGQIVIEPAPIISGFLRD